MFPRPLLLCRCGWFSVFYTGSCIVTLFWGFYA
nr:MAG TPA: hypothetical protein [Caudoviricetes sp.]